MARGTASKRQGILQLLLQFNHLMKLTWFTKSCTPFLQYAIPVKEILGELLYNSQLLPQNTRKSSNIPQLQATRRSTLAENRLTYYQMTAIFKRLLVSSSFETSYSHGYQVRRIIQKVLQWQNLNCQRLSWSTQFLFVNLSPTQHQRFFWNYSHHHRNQL